MVQPGVVAIGTSSAWTTRALPGGKTIDWVYCCHDLYSRARDNSSPAHSYSWTARGSGRCVVQVCLHTLDLGSNPLQPLETTNLRTTSILGFTVAAQSVTHFPQAVSVHRFSAAPVAAIHQTPLGSGFCGPVGLTFTLRRHHVIASGAQL